MSRVFGLFLVLAFYTGVAYAQSTPAATLSILCLKEAHLKGSTSTSIQVNLSPVGQTDQQVSGSFAYVQVWHGSFPIENDARGAVGGVINLKANALIDARLQMTILGEASELEIVNSVGRLSYNSSHTQVEDLQCGLR